MEKTKLSVQEEKKIALDILLDFAEFCDAHDLQYFLAYGTLIGAIRHKGYIPWDDDIDVQMPREDYDRLIHIYNSEKKNQNFELIDPWSKRARHSFVKIVDNRTVKVEPGIDYRNGYLGIDIDVFPLDGMPSDDAKLDKWHRSLMRVYNMYLYCVLDTKKSLKRKIAVPLIRFFTGGKNALLKKAMKLHAKYPYGSCEYVGSIESPWNNKRERSKKSCFVDSVLVEFEGHLLKAPIGYHEILTATFGDYMTPPEDQTTHHVNAAYLIEK